MTTPTLDTFTAAYIECALWSTCDMPPEATVDDIAPETLARMVADCREFQEIHIDDILPNLELAGHDFWLTREGHGAGFWDGDWTDAVGKRLTAASKAYGSFNLYVGDDGKVHGS